MHFHTMIISSYKVKFHISILQADKVATVSMWNRVTRSFFASNMFYNLIAAGGLRPLRSTWIHSSVGFVRI